MKGDTEGEENKQEETVIHKAQEATNKRDSAEFKWKQTFAERKFAFLTEGKDHSFTITGSLNPYINDHQAQPISLGKRRSLI